MRRIVFVCALLAASLAAGLGLAAPPADQAAPEPAPPETAALQAESGGACDNVVALDSMPADELERWMAGAGVEAIEPTPAGATDPPLCPDRISCEACGQGNGPCFLTPFGSDSCCTSPYGPCFQCEKGQTIYVSSCPCFGELNKGRCPPRDQDWFCA